MSVSIVLSDPAVDYYQVVGPYITSLGAFIENLTGIPPEYQMVLVCNKDQIKSQILHSGPNPIVEVSPTPKLGEIVQANKNWDGCMMHPKVKGVSITHGSRLEVISPPDGPAQPGWTYLSLLDPPYRSTGTFSFLFGPKKVQGYVPESYISVIRYSRDQSSKVEQTGQGLPEFRYPKATGMGFIMNLGESHSFVSLGVDYNLVACPSNPTRVTITLTPSPAFTQRISSVSVLITIPGCTVLDMQVHDTPVEEAPLDEEVKSEEIGSSHLDWHGTKARPQGGALKKPTIRKIETRPKVSRRHADVETTDVGTKVRWEMEALGALVDWGLCEKEFITFTLDKKPAAFKYKCQVSYSINGGKNKTKTKTNGYVRITCK